MKRFGDILAPLGLLHAARAVVMQGHYIRRALSELRLAAPWQRREDGFYRRQYRSYDDYVRHQRAKLSRGTAARLAATYDEPLHAALPPRLADCSQLARGTVVLCLGARLGGEVRAFLDRGCFAVGVDLNPGPNNPYVLTGDFHALQFPDHTVDAAFTNCLDHVFDLKRFLEEVQRVLKPTGLLIVEVMLGQEQDNRRGHYETFLWASVDSLIPELSRHGFLLVHRRPISRPLPGEHLRFIRDAGRNRATVPNHS